jgi:hypothetical protein
MQRLLVLVLVVLILAGLGGGAWWWWNSQAPFRVLEQHRATATAQVALVEAIGLVLAGLPPLEEDGFDPKPRLDFFAYEDPVGNVAFLCEEDFADLAKETDVDLRVEWDIMVTRVASLLRTGLWPDGSPPEFPDVVDELCSKVAQLEYVLVMRTKEYVPPEAVGEEQFRPGHFLGELHLFALEGARHLGGVRIGAVTDDTIEVRVEYTDSWLRSNLWETTRRTIDAAIAEHLPGTPPPFAED